MYDFLRGPMMWVSVIICIGGLAVRMIQFIILTRKAEPVFFATAKKDIEKKSAKNITLLSLKFIKLLFQKTDRTILKTQPLLALLTFIFHFCIIVTPVFLLAHNILFFESWGFDFLSFSEVLSDTLTAALIVCGIIFFIRRILVPEVRAVSRIQDYILLLITIGPFVTGFLAYHQFFEYKTMVMLHIVSGQLMLVAIGITKLSHMVFFFFSRFFMGGEYGFNAGRRIWIR